MAKKKEPTIKEQLLEVVHTANAEYLAKWKAAWKTFKTVIGPFVKGIATYAWTLVYGSLYYLGYVIYNCGKVLLNALLKVISKA